MIKTLKKLLVALLIVFQTIVVSTNNKVYANEITSVTERIPFGRLESGTVYISYTIYSNDLNFSNNALYAKELKKEIGKIEKLSDNFIEYFEEDNNLHNVWYINNNPNTFIEIEEVLYDIIKYSEEIKEHTYGYFDISIGKIVDEWKKLISEVERDLFNNVKVDKNEFNERVEAIKSIPVIKNGIELKQENDKYYVKIKDGAKIDLGGIAKGYAVDYIGKYFNDKGVKYYKINGAGSSLMYGEKPTDGGYYNIGILNPFAVNDIFGEDIIGTVKVKNTSISTSGDTNQNVYFNKRYYHHIISPVSKMPEVYYRQMTIVNDNGALSDALTTAMFSMDEKTLQKFLETTWAKENKVNEFIAFKTNKQVLNGFENNEYIPGEGVGDLQKTMRDWLIISVIVIIAALGVFMFSNQLNNADYNYAIVKYHGNEVVRIDFANKKITHIDQPQAEGYPIINEEEQTITLLGDYEINRERQILVISFNYETKLVKIVKEESPNNICSKQAVRKGRPIICIPNNIRVDFIRQAGDSSEII